MKKETSSLGEKEGASEVKVDKIRYMEYQRRGGTKDGKKRGGRKPPQQQDYEFQGGKGARGKSRPTKNGVLPILRPHPILMG